MRHEPVGVLDLACSSLPARLWLWPAQVCLLNFGLLNFGLLNFGLLNFGLLDLAGSTWLARLGWLDLAGSTWLARLGWLELAGSSWLARVGLSRVRRRRRLQRWALHGQCIAAGPVDRLARTGEALLVVESLAGHTQGGSGPVMRMSPAGSVGSRGYRVGVATSGWNLKP
jgi:hypothetical protein